jgi:hyaluronoglucosaminidase
MKKNPLLTKEKATAKAQILFEAAANNFMNRTIRRAQKLRKFANWGYYGYPLCFNRERKDRRLDSCPTNVLEENDQIKFIFEESDVIYPSVYLTEATHGIDVKQFVHGKVAEARRVALYSKKASVRVLAFVRYQYSDTLNYVDNVSD